MQYQNGSKTNMLRRSLGQGGKTGLSQNCSTLTMHCSTQRNTVPGFLRLQAGRKVFLAIFEQISENEVGVLYPHEKQR